MRNTGYKCAQGHWHYTADGVITCDRAFMPAPVGTPDPELIEALRAIVVRGLTRTINRIKVSRASANAAAACARSDSKRLIQGVTPCK